MIASLEKGFDLVKTLIAVGPMTAWDQIKEMGTEMRDAFVEAATEWVHNTIVMKAIETIGSLLVPGAGIIRAIVGIYDSVMFFVQKAKDIARMVGNFLSSVGEIAAGNIGAAASALENGLATALSLVIDFLARFLHLSGISEKIKKAIQKIRGKVDAAMDKVARWIADKGKKLVGAAKAGAAKIFEWWKVRSKFKGRDGKQHQMYFTGSGATATLTVATTPMVLEKFLAQLTNVDDDQKASQRIVLENKKIIDDLKEKSKGSFDEKDGEIIKRSLKIIADELPKLGTAKLPPSVINWRKKPFGKNVVGTRMVANPLSIHPGKHAGSQPYEDSDLWKAVNRRSGTYVKGHLLNHHVHGPGNNENLIPITYSLNTTMESRVEDKIKHAVLSENKVIKYEVTMTFGQPVRKHLPAESELPKSIEFSATEMKEQDGKWVETTNKLPVPPSLPHNLPADESVGIVHEEVNLSEASSSQLGEIPGIGPVLATRILEVKEKLGRKFRIYSDLENVKGIGDEKLKYLKEEKWIKLF